MDICDTLVSATRVLSEQIALQLFDVLPEGGPVFIIMARDGHCWSSNAEELARLNVDPLFLKELRAKVDDGVEPVVTQIAETGVVAAQLATERTNYGYIVVALPGYSPESTLSNIDLVETLLNLVGLVGRLIEKAGTAAQAQVRCYRGYGEPMAPLN